MLASPDAHRFPYIQLNWRISLMVAHDGERRKPVITSSCARRDVQPLRAQSHAILTSSANGAGG